MLCEKCGKEIHSGATYCEFCGHENAQVADACAFDAHEAHPGEVAKPENVIAGIVGALLGAVLGGASIVILGQLGYVASISGLLLAICTLKGYELLGGRLSTKGIVVSILLMLVTPYLADRINWAIEIIKVFDQVSFAEAFDAVPEIIELSGVQSEYIKELLMVYGFAALGAVSTLVKVFKNKKTN